jgi:ABC-type multidrug transport system fused ATPase/permease subunit
MIAIVGESGAGKSTLIDVIMGFNEPTKGTVYIDGVPLQDYDIQSYRNKIGYVPQESALFNMSIVDNLRWAKDDATDEEIKFACKLAFADEFIESLSDKYNTLVGDRGVRLSGGQAQRISLARALIRDPELVILDEATSELDTRSELMIKKAIDNLSDKTTIVIIAHRLSTISKADYVYVLENGFIIEEGSYRNLRRKTDSRLGELIAEQALG